MAVIFFCLRPHAQKRAGTLRQPASYIWVLPAENPLGLVTLYVSNPLYGKGKFAFAAGEAVEISWGVSL